MLLLPLETDSDQLRGLFTSRRKGILKCCGPWLCILPVDVMSGLSLGMNWPDSPHFTDLALLRVAGCWVDWLAMPEGDVSSFGLSRRFRLPDGQGFIVGDGLVLHKPLSWRFDVRDSGCPRPEIVLVR